MAKYNASINFELEESQDAEVMLQSMQTSLVAFFNLHPFYFKNVAIDLKKEEKSAD